MEDGIDAAHCTSKRSPVLQFSLDPFYSQLDEMGDVARPPH
jgi:hypothetical protein